MSVLIRDQIRSEIPQQLYDFWDNSRGSNELMAVEDIDLSKIGNCLPNMVIFDVVGDPRRFRFRFAGTAIDELNGQFRTGKYLDEIDLGGLTNKTVVMMHDVVDRREPSYYRGKFVCRDNRIVRYERVAMPLTSDGKTVDSILIGLQYLLFGRPCQTSRYEKLPAYLGWWKKLHNLLP